jgi:hypothetical protein
MHIEGKRGEGKDEKGMSIIENINYLWHFDN